MTLIPITQSTQAQVGIGDLADIQVCATDLCSVRLTQSKVFGGGWELSMSCWMDGEWESHTSYGSGVYHGSLCNGAISYQGEGIP